jgi:hypothetical protein
MIKYATRGLLLFIGIASLLEAARGGYGYSGGGYREGGGYGEEAGRGDYYDNSIQRTPALSRAELDGYGGGWSSGGTTVIEPNYPPPQGGPQAPYPPPPPPPQ